MDEPALGGPWRSRRCTGRVVDSDSHCKRQFARAARRPQRSALPRRRLALVAQTPRFARSEERGAGSEEARGGSGRCAGCVAGSNSHWQCRFRRPVTLPQAPALPRRRLWASTLWSPRRSFATKAPARDPGRQNRARCAWRAAPWRRASDSASPPSLGRAPVQPDSSISKSGPRDLEFECPVVAFKIERAKCQVGASSQSSMTKRSFRHGFEFCTGWCRPSCSTWKFKQFDFFSTVWASGRRRGGERTSDFGKPAALRGLNIAFGLTFATPSGVRSTPGTTGRGAPLP